MDDSLRALVRSRSGGVCEYCRVPDGFDRLPFQVDHIIAEKHGGATVETNLAWSCYDCNLYKGPNIAGVDPDTQEVTVLYDPRTESWRDHFRYADGEIVGTTPQGRTTIQVLRINLPRRVELRRALTKEGVYLVE